MTLEEQLERSVALCRVAREKERAAVVRDLRAAAATLIRDGGEVESFAAKTIRALATRYENGDHVRDELGGRDDKA